MPGPARHDPVRVLIVGCGMAARIHARVLRSMPGVELTFASQTPGRAAEYQARFGGVASWRTYEEGTLDPHVQVVLVATPPASHATLALLALAAGKHVIMEKPAFASSSQFDVVRAAADATGRQVFVAENYVYKPIARFLRDVITSGDLGDVRFVSLNATRWQAASGWRADPALSGGGALFESGVHWISLAARLGLAIESVQGFRVGAETGTDRSSLSVIRFATGAMGTLAHSWELPAPLGGLRISKVQGTRGAVTFESNGLMSITSGRRKGVRLHLVDAMGYRAMHADFQRAITRQVSASYTLEMAHDDFRWLEVVQRDLTGPSSHALVPEYTCVP